MKIAIRYFTRSGNTKKLADAIGTAINVPALPISEAIKEDVDLLFLGGALYGFDIDESLKAFIANLSSGTVKKTAVFSTTAVAASAYPHIKKRLEAQGFAVEAREYHCRGKFTLLHKNHPNEQDCAEAAEFAKNFTSELNI
jgi:flavodoxin